MLYAVSHQIYKISHHIPIKPYQTTWSPFIGWENLWDPRNWSQVSRSFSTLHRAFEIWQEIWKSNPMETFSYIYIYVICMYIYIYVYDYIIIWLYDYMIIWLYAYIYICLRCKSFITRFATSLFLAHNSHYVYKWVDIANNNVIGEYVVVVMSNPFCSVNSIFVDITSSDTVSYLHLRA